MRLWVIVVFAMLAAPVAGEVLEGKAYVVDGETLMVADRLVSLSGVFSPELDQQCFTQAGPWACGAAAKEALASRVGGKVVRCESPHSGDDARFRCQYQSLDIGAWLLTHGWALASQHASADYRGRQDRAVTAQLGIWREGFDPNQTWRDWAAGQAEFNDCSVCALRKQSLKKKRDEQPD